VLHADAITVARGRRVLAADLTLAVAAGELVHVAGPNGCGKSSLLRALAGVVEPRRGRVTRAAPCWFVPERLELPAAMRAGRFLRLAGAAGARVDGTDRRCGELSQGQLQRVALAGALERAHDRPAVLVLDEPWAGLDAPARAALGSGLASAADRGSAVIFTDHSGAGTLRATRTLSLGDRSEHADARVLVALARGGEETTLVVADPAFAARLGAGWTVRDAEPLP
jgi:ABC-type transport system involved in cytochrome c biogenesis ATPase subunit